MRKIFLPVVVLTFALGACTTKDKKSLITGKWQAVSLENAKLDELMKEQAHFLDTFGRNNTPEQNMEIYGTSNLDSLREMSQKEMVEYMAMQDHAVKNTTFEFKKDGIVIMNFSGQIDTTGWHIGDDGKLTLDETSTTADGQKITMEILSLTDTMMKLQMNEQGMNSTVIFKPASK